MAASLFDKSPVKKYPAIVESATERAFQKIDYTCSKDISGVSTICTGLGDHLLAKELSFKQIELPSYLAKSRHRSDLTVTTAHSLRNQLASIQKISWEVDRRCAATERSNLQDIITCNIKAAAQRILALDEDGKQQLIFDSKQNCEFLRFWECYSKKMTSPKEINESYALDMKLRFHKLDGPRNYENPPARETVLIHRLLEKDVQLLDTFPHVLQRDKEIVRIAIKYFQSIHAPKEVIEKSFSELKPNLCKDEFIVIAACSDPQTHFLVERLASQINLDKGVMAKVSESVKFVNRGKPCSLEFIKNKLNEVLVGLSEQHFKKCEGHKNIACGSILIEHQKDMHIKEPLTGDIDDLKRSSSSFEKKSGLKNYFKIILNWFAVKLYSLYYTIKNIIGI